MDFFEVLVVSLGIGIVVGITGMGGGALMTPALIFLGINPTVAVANDLVAAGVNKSVGAAVHGRKGAPDWRMAGWLALGSVPCAFSGAFIVDAVGASHDQQAFVKRAIGVALLVAAGTYALRVYLALRDRVRGRVHSEHIKIRPLPTVAIGAVGGMLVGLTSVGSGSVIMVTLLLLYPGLTPVRLVGTDLVQAVPLVIAAAVSHVFTSGVDWSVLVPLVIGGTPGTYLGSQIAHRVQQRVVRRGIVLLLLVTGLGLLGVDPALALLAGVLAFVASSLVWSGVRRVHGLPAFYHRGTGADAIAASTQAERAGSELAGRTAV